jgi:hypothetical protein
VSSADGSKQLAGFAVFVVACMFLAFLAGMLVAIFELFPYQPVRSAVNVIADRVGGDAADDGLHFLHPARNDDAGVTILQPESVQPGVTLVTSYWRDSEGLQPGIRLLDLSGNVLHEWQIHPEQIWPQSPHSDRVSGNYNNPDNYVHGSSLLPDGDIVFNIEYLGMVRMNACGDVRWRLPYRLHHAVERDDDGNFWAAGLHWREERMPEYPHMGPPFVDEVLVQVSPEGEVLREIFILESLYDSGYHGTLMSNKKSFDLTHMNDVEVLSAQLADRFPMFNAGDIMVSLRNFSMVLVVDGLTGQVKWHFQHPLIHQHDPDFEPDGSIVIFDNHDDGTGAGDKWGRSQILRVDPASKAYERLYPTSDEQVFYTEFGGKHQLLENGNRLITEARVGRVFEVTPEGETVWSWVNESREGSLIPEVLEGTRYPAASAGFVASLDCR